MSANGAKIPPGLHLSAVAAEKFEVTNGVNGKGRPYCKVIGRGIAAGKFVKVTQFIDLQKGEAPVVFEAGETFEGAITGVDGFEKGREVISLFVELRRPSLGTEGPKK